MSTYYGIHCRTCNSDTGCGIKTMSDVMQDIIDVAPFIKAVRNGDHSGYLEFDILGGFDGHSDLYLFDWVCEHADHQLEVYNEIGYYKSENPERF